MYKLIQKFNYVEIGKKLMEIFKKMKQLFLSYHQKILYKPLLFIGMRICPTCLKKIAQNAQIKNKNAQNVTIYLKIIINIILNNRQ